MEEVCLDEIKKKKKEEALQRKKVFWKPVEQRQMIFDGRKQLRKLMKRELINLEK